MKDQYFGDVNDYAKYALLRRISRGGALRMTICWMLTDADGSADGRSLGYLQAHDRYAGLDPDLFRFLLDSVTAGRRNVAAIESSSLLEDVAFCNKSLSDDLGQRTAFFRDVWRLGGGSDVIFFDPDNGLSVSSVTKGVRNSRKYLFWDELGTTTSLGHSAIVYQHFPRVARAHFVEKMMSRMRAELRVESFAAYTSNVAFLAAARPEHELHLRGAMGEACADSNGLLTWAG